MQNTIDRPPKHYRMVVDLLANFCTSSIGKFFSPGIPDLLCPPPTHSVAFGMRKALMAEQGKTDMEQCILDLEAEKRDLEQQVTLAAD